LGRTIYPCWKCPIKGREGNTLHIADVDMLDNTPHLDIKPSLPEIEARQTSRAAWFETSDLDRRVADGHVLKTARVKGSPSMSPCRELPVATRPRTESGVAGGEGAVDRLYRFGLMVHM